MLVCKDRDWLHGHWSSRAGATHYDGPGELYYAIALNTNWVVTCGRNIQTPGSAGTIIMGVVTSVAEGGLGQCELAINRYYIQPGDWQLSKVYVWNTHLPNSFFAQASSRLVKFLNSAEPSYDFSNFWNGLLNTLILGVKHLDNYYT